MTSYDPNYSLAFYEARHAQAKRAKEYAQYCEKRDLDAKWRKEGEWTDNSSWEMRGADGECIAGFAMIDHDTISIGAQYSSDNLTLSQLDEYISALVEIRDRMKEEQS